MAIQDTLLFFRQQIGAERLTPAQAVDVLNRTAYEHRQEGYGLLTAPSGGNGTYGPSGDYVRLDILVHKPSGKHFDVFVDAPDAHGSNPSPEQLPHIHNGVYWGRAEPAWQDKGPVDVSRWVAPVAPPTLPVPEVPEVPKVPEEDPFADYLAEFNALKAQVEALEVQLAQVQKKVFEDGFSIKILGRVITLR